MWMASHQRPWILSAILAGDLIALRASLAGKLAEGGYTRLWLVVGSDQGFWREERLCRRPDGSWMLAIDAHRVAGAAARPPSAPAAIAEFEAAVYATIERDGVREGGFHVHRSPGLMLVGYDRETDELWALTGYRSLLDAFWRIRAAGRLARGTTPRV